MFVLKSYLFYLRRFSGSYSPKQIFFSPQTILCQFSSIFFFFKAVYIFQIVTSPAWCHLEYILPLLSYCCALITSLFVKWEGPFLSCQQTELVQSNTQNSPAFQHVQPVIQLSSCLQKDLNLHLFQDLIEISSRQDPGKKPRYNHKKAAHCTFYQCAICGSNVVPSESNGLLPC